MVDRAGGDDRRVHALGGRGPSRSPLTGFGSPTPNGVRIGPVYTPPEHRGRGYASALVAEVSQRASMLADASASSTPTSPTRLEQDLPALGYERVGDSVELDFV